MFKRRSWGYYITLLDRKHFKVKLLRFYTNKKCSKQYHFRRSEVWLFLKGNGRFLREIDSYAGHKNHISYPSKGDFIEVGKQVIHQFIAAVPTWVLEIQYGEKCEEGDIMRI